MRRHGNLIRPLESLHLEQLVQAVLGRVRDRPVPFQDLPAVVNTHARELADDSLFWRPYQSLEHVLELIQHAAHLLLRDDGLVEGGLDRHDPGIEGTSQVEAVRRARLVLVFKRHISRVGGDVVLHYAQQGSEPGGRRRRLAGLPDLEQPQLEGRARLRLAAVARALLDHVRDGRGAFRVHLDRDGGDGRPQCCLQPTHRSVTTRAHEAVRDALGL